MNSKVRAIALVMIAPLVALSFGMTLALTSASTEPPVTATFVGTSTTGPGQAFPIEVDQSDVLVRDDSAVGLAYTYGAAGQVTSGLPGHFTYEEKGRIYFMDPADPTTQSGSDLHSAEFSLLPADGDPSKIVTVSDSCSECYSNGHEQGKLSSLPTWARDFAIDSLITSSTPAGSDPMLTYGYFTFTNDHGEFKGYATPDFRKFVIQITFDVADGE